MSGVSVDPNGAYYQWMCVNPVNMLIEADGVNAPPEWTYGLRVVNYPGTHLDLSWIDNTVFREIEFVECRQLESVQFSQFTGVDYQCHRSMTFVRCHRFRVLPCPYSDMNEDDRYQHIPVLWANGLADLTITYQHRASVYVKKDSLRLVKWKTMYDDQQSSLQSLRATTTCLVHVWKSLRDRRHNAKRRKADTTAANPSWLNKDMFRLIAQAFWRVSRDDCLPLLQWRREQEEK